MTSVRQVPLKAGALPSSPFPLGALHLGLMPRPHVTPQQLGSPLQAWESRAYRELEEVRCGEGGELAEGDMRETGRGKWGSGAERVGASCIDS